MNEKQLHCERNLMGFYKLPGISPSFNQLVLDMSITQLNILNNLGLKFYIIN